MSNSNTCADLIFLKVLHISHTITLIRSAFPSINIPVLHVIEIELRILRLSDKTTDYKEYTTRRGNPLCDNFPGSSNWIWYLM